MHQIITHSFIFKSFGSGKCGCNLSHGYRSQSCKVNYLTSQNPLKCHCPCLEPEHESLSQMSNVELGGHRRSVAGSDMSGDGSVCFSDADDGSCYSHFYSTNGGSYDDYSFSCVSDPEVGGAPDSRRVSSVSDCSVVVEIESGVPEIKVHLAKIERDCRICHLGLESDSHECGVPIELGCSCKDDLAAAHKNCAEAWFKIKGNRTCEICHSIAQNVYSTTEEMKENSADSNNANAASTVSTPAPGPSTETQRSLQEAAPFNNTEIAQAPDLFVFNAAADVWDISVYIYLILGTSMLSSAKRKRTHYEL
ncbi:hypothetical protein L6164_003450 [Bauhinia variegata]|uniref:Uncharacterized protein n=1 Tax=Bauhinia variegata TaxID=167791 RepID=A0ACB9Q412_BAUVA|nr:hypothetical protein L6164_003450 [Bauhinia variegata]